MARKLRRNSRIARTNWGLTTLIALSVFVWTSISIAATTAGNSSIRNKPGHNACVLAAQKIEAEQRLPRMLLSTISLVETGKWVRETRENIAWPWTVNARGQSRYYRSKATAIAAVRGLQSSGLRSIDVGCMQINLYYHPDAFASLEEAFDPQTNVSYAADFLKSLRKKGRSWNTAIGYYHSRTRARYIPYQRKVQKLWRAERRRVALERRAKQRRTASRTIVEY